MQLLYLHAFIAFVCIYCIHPLRRPKQVRFCTGMSANLVQVICPIYLLFLTTKFDYSIFWPNYPEKCMIFLQKSHHNFCHFTHFSVKCTIFWGFFNYKTLLFVIVPSFLFFCTTKNSKFYAEGCQNDVKV